jgi:DNA-binding NtrC family response regulator
VPLKELVAEGKMRSDFYYRVNVIPIHLIPLRERREDIPLLVHDFLHHHPVAVSKGISGVSPSAMSRLAQHSWPGNIRELQNVLERAIVTTDDRVIDQVDLPESASQAPSAQKEITLELPLREWLQEQEKQYLAEQLRAFGGRIGPTAKHSGMDVKTLYRKMRVYGLDKRDFRRNSLPGFIPSISASAGWSADTAPRRRDS